MNEMNLEKSRFCGPFTKKVKNKKMKDTRDSRYVYQNELVKVCFQHDVTHGSFKDLSRR